MPASGPAASAATLDIDALTLVAPPAPTDAFIVSQGGPDNLRELRSQIHALEVGEHLELPQVNEPLTPTLSFGVDSGFYEISNARIGLSLDGLLDWIFDTTAIESDTSFGGRLRRAAASATVPGVGFTGDEDTGLGRAAADDMTLIAGGVVGANVVEAAGVVQFIVPLQNNLSFPSFSFGDGDSGFFESADDNVNLSIAGLQAVFWDGASMQVTGRISVVNADGGSMVNEAASTTNPTLLPIRTDVDSGIGADAGTVDTVSVIAGGVQVGIFREVAGVVQFIVPLQNNATNPSIAIGDGDSGLFEAADDDLQVSIAATARWRYVANAFEGIVASSPALLNEAATGTNPTLLPNRSDTDTGVGSPSGNQVSLIAGGVECARVDAFAGLAQLLAADGVGARPSLAFINDPLTGFFSSASSVIGIALGSSELFQIDAASSGLMRAQVASGAAIRNIATTATVPSLIASVDDLDTGIGHQAADNLSIVAGGLEAARIEDPADLAAGETSLWIFDDDNNQMEQVEVGGNNSGGGGFKLLRIPN